MSRDETNWTASSLRAAMARGISYVGQFADLSHEQFVQIVESTGGRYLRYSNHGRYAVIVVGGAGLPVLPSGEPMNLPDPLITERQFVELMDVEPPINGEQLYTIDTLSELLHAPPRRIAAWVKAGLIQPDSLEHGVARFRFSQVAVAQTLCGLMAAGVSIERLRRTLQQLQQRMPDLREPLQQLTLLERNGPMLVRLENGDLSEISGQLQLEFDSQPQPQPVQLRLVPALTTASDWHEQGVEQERAGMLTEAEASYRQALLVGGPTPQIVFDLASVLASQGRVEPAVERYRQAIELDPRFVDAWNNLGILLSQSSDHTGACEAFRRALQLAPDDAKLHYNLADELEAAGQLEDARIHWRAYLRYDPAGSAWAEHAAERLRRLA
jgi:tetratricopeptide (TPR) repeat protein